MIIKEIFILKYYFSYYKVIFNHCRTFEKYQRAENKNHKYKHPEMTGTFEYISM